MNKTTKEMIEVMQACEEGKKIQCRGLLEEDWHDIGGNPLWNWGDTDYRVKPNPTYRPYESTDELIADYKARFNVDNPSYTMPLIWIKRNDTSHKGKLINSFGEYGVWLNTTLFSMQDLFEYYTYIDCSPCGKLVEE